MRGLAYEAQQRFVDAVWTDESCKMVELLWRYKDAPAAERELIDDLLITLCGWSLPALVTGHDKWGEPIEGRA